MVTHKEEARQLERENTQLKAEVEELKRKLISLEIRNGGKAGSLDDEMLTREVWHYLALLQQGQMYVGVARVEL